MAKEIFNIYPNSAKDELNIESQTNENFSVVITDVTGKKVFSESNIRLNKTIDVSRIENGIYFISISSDTQTANRKIIIQR